jgi:hypothetical protein
MTELLVDNYVCFDWITQVRVNLLRFELAFGFDFAGMNPEEAEAGSPHAG